MSVEEFHAGFPADESFVKDISRRPEFGTISPIKLMAGIYIKEGSHGLSQIAYKRAYRQDSSTLRINKGEDESVMRNASAIYFGTSISAIEDIIIDGYFDQEKVNAVLINSFSGTELNPIIFSNPEYEKIDSFSQRTLTQIAMRDKTFYSFFKDKYYALPRSLRAFMAQTKLFKYMEDMILPEYTERIKRIISANEQRKSQEKSRQ